jgi:hypothetical protein
MIFIIALTFIIVLFILIDLVPVFKQKQWLIFWVYTILTAIVYVSALLIVVDIKIPSPAPLIKEIVTKVWGLG